MVRYRRNFVPGGTYFFTVTLFDRRSSLLVDRIDALRAAFRVARRERPFLIDAIVILPMAYVTLTIDHRVVDGHQTNVWLTRFVEILEGWPAA